MPSPSVAPPFCALRPVFARIAAFVFLASLALGCQSAPETRVRSHLSGRITVSAAIDSVRNYSGFNVLVANANGRAIDTLALATTDINGDFATAVRAPSAGIYPLLVRRRGNTLARAELVVTDGDSATLDLELPHRGLVRIQSEENAALLAYRNTMALHRQMAIRNVRTGQALSGGMGQSVRQTSSILWSLRRTYPDAYATQLASVEAIALLEGWNDSLAVEYVREISPANPRYVEAVRVGRRAIARLHGQPQALAFLDSAQQATSRAPEKAAIQAERVRAHLDSMQTSKAKAAARVLQTEYEDTQWAAWAERALYEMNNLMPNMKAPSFTVRDVTGDTLSLSALSGRPILLEFYKPGDRVYQQQVAMRNAIYRATRPQNLALLSISLEPDTLLNKAFREGRSLPGQHIILPSGYDAPLAQTYNVATVPTRFLIDADGRIVERYVGVGIMRLLNDLGIQVERRPPATAQRTP